MTVPGLPPGTGCMPMLPSGPAGYSLPTLLPPAPQPMFASPQFPMLAGSCGPPGAGVATAPQFSLGQATLGASASCSQLQTSVALAAAPDPGTPPPPLVTASFQKPPAPMATG